MYLFHCPVPNILGFVTPMSSAEGLYQNHTIAYKALSIAINCILKIVTVKCATKRQNEFPNFCCMKPKLPILPISLQISILEHVMIHKSYINVLIANIFQYRRILYDLPSSRYKNNPVIQAAMSQKTVFREYLKNQALETLYFIYYIKWVPR